MNTIPKSLIKFGVGIACGTGFLAALPAGADVQIGALACQPPYLAQAQNLRWHEHYLINPTTAPMGGVPQATWVVCPIAFESNDLPANEVFQVGAFGNFTQSGPGSLTNCVANVVDLRNQNIPEGGFLVNPGQNMIFTKQMSSQTPIGTLWSAWATITFAEIKNRMMSPPSTPVNPAGAEDPAFWTITVNCELKPGQALNMVSLWPTKQYVQQ
jgi:hypothetical protein